MAPTGIHLLFRANVQAAHQYCIAPLSVNKLIGSVIIVMSAQRRSWITKVCSAHELEGCTVTDSPTCLPQNAAQRYSGAWYSHWTRAFHEKLFASDFSNHHSGIPHARLLLKDENERSQYPIITYVGLGTLVYESVNYKTGDWMHRDGVHYYQDYLLPRLRSLGRKYASAIKKGNTELCIAEASFPLGPLLHQVHLIALLRKVGTAYEVVYSIPRRGYVAAPSSSIMSLILVQGQAQS